MVGKYEAEGGGEGGIETKREHKIAKTNVENMSETHRVR